MTRMSKQSERRAVSPRKHKKPSVKTGTRKDNLSKGFRAHENALQGTSLSTSMFIPKMQTK